MHDWNRKLILLAHIKGVSWKAIWRTMKEESEFRHIETFSPNAVPLSEILANYEENHIEVITIFDKKYPKQLKTIYQPPWVLFAKGNLSMLEDTFLLGVVGSRNASCYANKALARVLPGIIEAKGSIVSGLARGVDTIAHKETIRLGGKTIAVIAGGFQHIYPKENKGLAEYMMQKHLLLSEYPPDTRPEKWHFPQRNRIISGLSRGVLVVEAGRRSGSLITADFALSEGREVFAIPGTIDDARSLGANWLIQQGAKLVASHDDILEEIKL
ncbi:DNA-processing protein DprA [Bacillus massilinigeriensis]|uniref:DNA-processing protein DprA n=1 Tax=Bacillus mediterraneensis TaxID=1805474 RepID=UPI0008F8B3BB|nr:DNA-processing protein DprA [Bacillus mediterraneensis]